MLLRESQVQPLLLVFEDLHWIDAETQAVLDSLVESLPTARLLLLVNYRPEYQHGWGRKTYYSQLRLDPLPPASAEALLQALVGDDAGLQPLKQLLIERTEGNPFFLEESVRTLVETQLLVGERGAYRLARAVQRLQVPATVQAVLAARIDRLPAEDKALLQTAAVIGTEVPWPLLQTVAELPEEDLRRRLAHLQAAEFLYETSLFPELAYTFKHALTHEVAYGSLLHERLRTLHVRIVEALEGLAPDRLAEQVERLAHHAFQGGVWEKGVTYFWQAGAKAAARSAYREAVACFEQALEALAHLPENRDTLEQAIDLRLALLNVLVPLGENQRNLALLREAEPLAEALGDQHRLGWVSVYLIVLLLHAGDQERALACGQRALAIATACGELALQVVANFFLSHAYETWGDYRRAIELLSWNVASLEGELSRERFGLPSFPAVFCRGHLVCCLAELGGFTEGIGRGEEGVRLGEAIDHPFSLVEAYRGIAHLYLRKGDLQKAIPLLERSLGVCQVWHILLWSPWVTSSLGYAYALSGRLAEALPLLEQGEKQAVAIGHWWYHALLAAWLGEAYVLAGRIEEASQLAERALALSREQKQRGYQAWTLRLLGEIAAQRDPPEIEPAEAHYRQALALAEELGMRPLVAHCHLGLGTLYTKTGRFEQARLELTTASELFRAMEMTFWLPRAEAALAQGEGR